MREPGALLHRAQHVATFDPRTRCHGRGEAPTERAVERLRPGSRVNEASLLLSQLPQGTADAVQDRAQQSRTEFDG